MALDTKRKRGAATLLTMPWRHWLAEPDDTLLLNDRLSLLKLCEAPFTSGEFTGIEFTVPNALMHFTISSRLHFTVNENRPHSTTPEHP